MTTTPDPRPSVSVVGIESRVTGFRCATCGLPSLWASPRCASCGGRPEPTTFDGWGLVWSSTVVRVPVPGRTPPYSLAYVDLHDGPRILAHMVLDGEPRRTMPGTPVRVVRLDDAGDVLVEVVGAVPTGAVPTGAVPS